MGLECAVNGLDRELRFHLYKQLAYRPFRHQRFTRVQSVHHAVRQSGVMGAETLLLLILKRTLIRLDLTLNLSFTEPKCCGLL